MPTSNARSFDYTNFGGSSFKWLELSASSRYRAAARSNSQKGWLRERRLARTSERQTRSRSQPPDPRAQIGPYHDMPYALFRYPPEDEFAVRKEVTNLEIRLTGRGKGIHRISLAECLYEAMYAERPLEEWIEAEKEQGVASVVET